MNADLAKQVEAAVLKALAHQQKAASIKRLVEQITDQDAKFRGVDVKIAAMNLVARGKADLNERWQISPAVK